MQAQNEPSSMPMVTGEEFRDLRLSKGIGLRELARESGITASTISAFETGQRKGVRTDTYVKLMNVLDPANAQVRNATTATFSGVNVTRTIPVVGMAAAQMFDPAFGTIEMLWENTDDTIPCVIERGNLFALRVCGDSMEPDLHDGDIVAVSQDLPATGDTAVVCLRDEGIVIKKWYWRHGIIELRSLNPEGCNFHWTKEEVFQQGLILWRWKVHGILWRKL